ncbi:MAG: ParB N-terminal domain-containing protein [Spirochaetales bacterium]|jgi:ParB family chromosome partitioning protein|nr:ParB N-terminal domain-containing protein [Spirochaetales bacterium]
MEMRINDIVVKKRIRKNIGDISRLMESIRKHGLLNPVVVTRKGELIAGERRLESVKRLGWQSVPIHVVDNPSLIERLEIELDENIYRRSLSPDELADGFARIDKLKNPGFFRRIWLFIVYLWKKLFGKKS